VLVSCSNFYENQTDTDSKHHCKCL